MNYLDELLALYPAQDPLGRRYMLTHLSDLPLGLDSDAVLEFLWGETASPLAPLAHQARREMGRVLPAALRQAYGLEEGRRGVWSTYQMGGGGVSLEAAAAADSAQAEKLLSVAWHALAPLLDRAVRLIRSSSPRVRQAASLVAGSFHTRSSLDLLTAGLRDTLGRDEAAFALAAALAELGDPGGHDALLETMRASGARAPDAWQLLADLPHEKTLPLLRELVRGADSHGCCAVAQALATNDTPDGRKVLGELLGRRKSWVTAYVLDALAAAPRPDDVKSVWRVYAGESQEFLRVQAVKVLGAIASAEPIGLLERVLAEGGPRLQAAALEGLARQRVEVAPITGQLVPMLASPVLRLRVNAMLVLGRREPAPVKQALEAMLFSDQAMERVEAAFVLGYLRSSGAGGVLEHLALDDPALPVRVQAIKSLAKQEGEVAVPRLAACLEAGDPRLIALSARALASVVEAALPQAMQALTAALAKAPAPATRGVLLRALGFAASRRGTGETPAPLLEGLASDEQTVLLGALEGVKGLASEAAMPRLRALLTHAEARVRHRAAVAAFLGGELSATSPIQELVGLVDERQVLAGVNSLLEIAALVPTALPLPRFEPLRRALQAKADNATIVEFVKTERPFAKLAAPPSRVPRQPLPAAQFDPVAAPKLDLEAARERLKAAPKPKRSRPVAEPEQLSPGTVGTATYLTGLAALGQSWVRAYRPLLAIPLVLAVPLVLTLFRMNAQEQAAGPSSRAKPPPGALKVLDLKGSAEHAAKGGPAPLANYMMIQPGERLTTGPNTKLLLGDASGNTVWLGEGSALTLGVPATDATTPASTPYVFTEPEGDIFVEFSRAKAVELVAGGAKIQSSGGSFRVTINPRERWASPGFGVITVVAGGKSRRYGVGEQAPLPGS